MADYDYVFVGAGINALTAAAILGKRGHRVLLLERNPRAGGCLRTEEATVPGFVHDIMATTMVLFLTSPAYGVIGPDLEARGLAFALSDFPTGVLRPDGSHLVFSKDRARNIATFEAAAAGDGAAFAQVMAGMERDAPFLFSLLGGRLWSFPTVRLMLREALRRGPRNLLAWFGSALESSRGHLEADYGSDLARALWAPWGLHCGLTPESTYSAQMLKVIAFAVEAAGCPVVVGGASGLLSAFERLIADQNGEIRTDADVAAILPGRGGRAAGVELADGTRIAARKGVICSATPNQLYDRLLKDWPTPLPEEVRSGARRFRYGRGGMQMHYALSRPPRWKASADLGRVALIHITPGLDGVSRACNEADRGLLPVEPTICLGQPAALDPTRAPEGAGILWIQLLEVPRRIKGDAAGTISLSEEGWTAAVREAFADRVEALIAPHIEDFRDTVLARRSYSPADLEAMNINLLGGEPYGGACTVDQFFAWRPFKGSVNHQTHVPGLYHIGASTHPGPGLAGSSGFLLANALS